MAPFAVEITLYGRTQETYERLTGIPGSYARCLRGIRLLRERGLPLKLKTVAVTLNQHEIWAMKRFVEDLGLEFKLDGLINARIDCSHSPLAVRLKPWELVQLDLQGPRRVAEWQRFAAQFTGPMHAPGRELTASASPGLLLPVVQEATPATAGCASGGCSACHLAAVHGR